MSLRIALIAPRFDPYIGGVETHVARLAAELAARDHAVEVFTQRTDDLSPACEVVDGVRINRCGGLMSGTAYPLPTGIWRALVARRAGFDVIHAHAYHALAAQSALGFRRGDAPFVLTPHYHATGHTAPARVAHVAYRPFGRRLFRQARRVICVSDSEAELVRRDFGPDVASRTVTIPNGVDVDALVQAEPYQTDSAVVLSVGRLADYKNVELLVRAARTLPAGIRVVVAGDGPERGQLEHLAGQAGDGAPVTFLGKISDGELRRWYRSAAVSVQMSQQEAFGIVLLESLAAGSQVIASSIPAHRHVADIVGASHVRFLPPDASAGDLSESIVGAIRDGRPGADVVSRVPTWAAVAEQTEAVYAEALQG